MVRVIAVNVLFHRHSLALILVTLSVVSLKPAPALTQSKVDYKTVPILQAMKEVAPTPEINLATPDGKKLSLKDFRGKIVLLNFWASWCVPCRQEMPALEEVSQGYAKAGKPVTVIGVDASDVRSEAARFLAEVGVTYPTVYDQSGLRAGVAASWTVT